MRPRPSANVLSHTPPLHPTHHAPDAAAPHSHFLPRRGANYTVPSTKYSAPPARTHTHTHNPTGVCSLIAPETLDTESFK